jgi:hypothetical protein
VPGAALAWAVMQAVEISATGRAEVERIGLGAATSRAAAAEIAKRLTVGHVDSTGRARAIAAAVDLQAWDLEEAEDSAAAVAADVEGGADDWHMQRGKDS